MPGCHGAGTAERSYPTSEVRGAAARSYPTSEVRGGGQEELPHAPPPEARGGGREDLPPLEARGCGWKNNPTSKEPMAAQV